MNKITKIMLIATVVVLLISAGFVAYGVVRRQQPEPEQKVMAPDFTVYTLEGEPVKLSDFRGTPVVLNFWASWCGPCKSEMPTFDEACSKYAGQVAFVMVNLTDGYQETVEIASQFIAEQGYTFPVYYDTAGEAAARYGIASIPTTIFIDAEGALTAQYTGAMDMENLELGIAGILPE